MGCRPVGQQCLQAGYIFACAIRRRKQVRRRRLDSDQIRVTVRVDESRQHGLAGQIYDSSGCALMGLFDFGTRPHGENLPILHRNRLSLGLRIINGDNGTSCVY